jgi:4-hydroxybutyrate CoA-transferase
VAEAVFRSSFADLSERSGRRAHVRTVVTEWGVAELFGKSVRERAAALISIAHPAFRDELAAGAARMRLA